MFALQNPILFDKVCLKFQLPMFKGQLKGALILLSTVGDATVTENVVCHCYPEWHNIPVYLSTPLMNILEYELEVYADSLEQ